jgi:hypothetical protein
MEGNTCSENQNSIVDLGRRNWKEESFGRSTMREYNQYDLRDAGFEEVTWTVD